MSKKVRSARGDMVDFDLIKIKQQIASRPATSDVRARQDFIERKLHRRIKKVFPKKQAPVDVIEVDVEPAMPELIEEPVTPVALDVEPVEATPVEPQPTKQKARPKK